MSILGKHWLFGGAAAALCALLALSLYPLPAQDPGAKEVAKYVGAAKCKSCHNAEDKGGMFAKWSESPHAKAYQQLASEEAKQVAAAKGIADPQQAPECLRCHVTAHGSAADLLDKGYKLEEGVSCETCHGPGGLHVKARMRAAAKGEGKGQPGPLEIPAGENRLPDEALCRSCHNPESPTYKEFQFDERLLKIRHLHPNRKQPRVMTAEEKKQAK